MCRILDGIRYNEAHGGDAGLELVNINKCHACSGESLCESIDGCRKQVNLSGLTANGPPLNSPSIFGPVAFDSSTSQLKFKLMDAFRIWRDSRVQKKSKSTSTSDTSSDNGECTNRFRVLADSSCKKNLQYIGQYAGVCRHYHSGSDGCASVMDTVGKVN